MAGVYRKPLWILLFLKEPGQLSDACNVIVENSRLAAYSCAKNEAHRGSSDSDN